MTPLWDGSTVTRGTVRGELAPGRPSRSGVGGRDLRRAELVQVLGQHPPPGRPLVRPFLAPRVDPVRYALAAEDVAGVPRRVDVLPRPLTGGEDREPGSQHLELLAVHPGQEVQRRGVDQVLRVLALE